MPLWYIGDASVGVEVLFLALNFLNTGQLRGFQKVIYNYLCVGIIAHRSDGISNILNAWIINVYFKF